MSKQKIKESTLAKFNTIYKKMVRKNPTKVYSFDEFLSMNDFITFYKYGKMNNYEKNHLDEIFLETTLVANMSGNMDESIKKFINKMKEGTEKMEKVITKTNNKVKKENKEMNMEMENTKNVKKSKMYQEAEVMVFASNERNIKDVKEVKSTEITKTEEDKFKENINKSQEFVCQKLQEAINEAKNEDDLDDRFDSDEVEEQPVSTPTLLNNNPYAKPQVEEKPAINNTINFVLKNNPYVEPPKKPNNKKDNTIYIQPDYSYAKGRKEAIINKKETKNYNDNFNKNNTYSQPDYSYAKGQKETFKPTKEIQQTNKSKTTNNNNQTKNTKTNQPDYSYAKGQKETFKTTKKENKVNNKTTTKENNNDNFNIISGVNYGMSFTDVKEKIDRGEIKAPKFFDPFGLIRNKLFNR